MDSHIRDRVSCLQVKEHILASRMEPDQEQPQSISVVQRHHPDTSATLDVIVSGACCSEFHDEHEQFLSGLLIGSQKFWFLFLPAITNQIAQKSMECKGLVLCKVFSQRYSSRDEVIG